MDSVNKAKLEEVRLRTPRYLFRAWRSISGGNKRLNTPERITPLAFLDREQVSTVYDLMFDDFERMAKDHLTGKGWPFRTELSSWSQSLSFVLGLYSHTVQYISIIDTQECRKSNPAFYVPLLPIHSPGSFAYLHEYLIHGVVSGPCHRAVPIQAFRRLDLRSESSFDWILGSRGAPKLITWTLICQCRELGDYYGDRFALAVTLAKISSFMIRKRKEPRIEPSETVMILEGVRGMSVLSEWATDASVMTDIVHVRDWPEVKQFILLMRYVARQTPEIRLEDEEEDEEPDGPKCVTYEEGRPKKDQAAAEVEAPLHSTRGKPKVLKPAVKVRRPVTRGAIREEKEKLLIHLMKGLRIDMNRHGKKAHEGKNERSVKLEDIDMGYGG